MCRNIKRLYNFEPPATTEEVQAASLQFVRKISGYTKPSKANESAFQLAVEDVSNTIQALLDSLVTNSPRLDREIETLKHKKRMEKRFS